MITVSDLSLSFSGQALFSHVESFVYRRQLLRRDRCERGGKIDVPPHSFR